MAIAKAVQLIKGGSSKWVREHGREWGEVMWEKFAWQEGYAAFSTSVSSVGDVVAYIQNQEEHHRVRTFEEEYLALLKKNGIGYEREYVFG